MTCVTSKTQTNGVGKPGSSWISPPGNMYASYIIPDPGLEAHILIQIATVAAVRILPEVCKIKWLNDLMINDKKVGGIICDRIRALDRIVIGVGINLQTSSVSSSILDETGILLEPVEVAIEYGESLISAIQALGKVTDEFNTKLLYKEQLVRFIANEQTGLGILKGISLTGELQILTELGLEVYRDCRILPPTLSAPGGN